MDTQTFINLGLVMLFVVIGGVFAATELALVSLRESQLNSIERQSARGARVAAVARDPNRFLAAVQIGVTVAGFLSAAYGGSTLAPDVAPFFEDLGLGTSAAQTTALIVMTLVIAYLSLVFGELVPKRLALQKPVGISVAVAPVLDRFATLMRPVIWLLSHSTNAMVRLLGGDPEATAEQVSEEELRDMVSTHEDLDETERRILRDVFVARQSSLKEVMLPRGDVDFLPGSMALVEAADRVRDLPHSRYPITGSGFDDVIGFLHVRDLLGVTAHDRRTVADVGRSVLMLPSSKRVLASVATMREEGAHLAIVVDEYGGTDGIVTLEDLIEELIGDIRDEYDAADPGFDLDPSIFVGTTTLEEFADATGIELVDGAYETIAGYLLAELGRLAVVGDQIEIPGGELAVSSMSGMRIKTITFTPSDSSEASDLSPSDTSPLP